MSQGREHITERRGHRHCKIFNCDFRRGNFCCEDCDEVCGRRTGVIDLTHKRIQRSISEIMQYPGKGRLVILTHKDDLMYELRLRSIRIVRDPHYFIVRGVAQTADVTVMRRFVRILLPGNRGDLMIHGLYLLNFFFPLVRQGKRAAWGWTPADALRLMISDSLVDSSFFKVVLLQWASRCNI